MKNKSLIPLCVSISILSLNGFCNEPELSHIKVTAQKVVLPTKMDLESVYTGSQISTKGIELAGENAKVSVYEAVKNLSGIAVESVDSSGLAIEQGSVRMRGVKSYLGASTVDGVPNYGGNPIGPRDYLYDMENMSGISIFKGGVPADIGVGVGSRGGAVELHPSYSSDKFSTTLSQSVGSNSFTRTFFRVDSGILNSSGTKVSASASFADGSKWRGKGDVGERKNINLSLSQPVDEKLNIKVWFNHNDQKQHLYRALSFKELEGGNLNSNYKKDFNDNKTGVVANDIYYFDYNYGEYKNDDLILSTEYKLNDKTKLIFKPYYSSEDTKVFQGSANSSDITKSKIQKRVRDIEKCGLIVQLQRSFDILDAQAGYHYEANKMEVYTQNYHPVTFAYNGYGVPASSGTTKINSPYIKVASKNSDLKWQAGLKYFEFQDSDSEGFETNPTTFALKKAVNLDRKGDTHALWIPSFGVSYNLGSLLDVYANYSRTFIRPYSYLPLMNIYNINRASFQAKAITAQELFDGYKLETSDVIDIGVRYSADNFDISPTIFYGKHKNLLTNISDSRVLVGAKPVSYQQNIGKATSYGIEMDTNIYISKNTTLYINPTITKFLYDSDLSYQGTTFATKSKQLVDTPLFMFKSSLSHKIGSFEILPSVNYIGQRYGDVSHSEKVDANYLFDLKMFYTKKSFYGLRELKLSAQINNIFDKKYISTINVSDDNRNGASSYYQVAPRSLMISAGVKF